MPRDDPSSGTRVRYVGDYELLDEIGHGGMGIVWKARQRSLGRFVAVKMIAEGGLARPEAIARFRREAEAVAQLKHPGIVAIHETGEHEGCPYFSMEFVQGRHLDLSKQGEPLPAHKAAGYLIKVAEAVHYAHTHGEGMVHRDLKPTNILIDENDQPRITDFGLAKGLADTSELTHSGQLLGTPVYMPPEQASETHGKIGPRSDIYSLGAVLYYLVTGRPPLLGASREETIRQLLTAEPVSPRVLNASVPRDLETICLKCLEKEQARRYESAQALANDLQHFLRNEPIEARPVSPAERLLRWCGRNRSLAFAFAASVVLLIAVTLVSSISAIRVSKARNQAQIQQTRAEVREAESLQRLAGLKVAQGSQLVESGDLLGALAPFTEAMLLETNDPARLEAHRFRIASVLQQAPQIVQMWFPGGAVHHIELSPDGRHVLTAAASAPASTNGGAAQIWDWQTGEPVTPQMRHQGTVTFATFSPDGQRVVTASLDGTARIWDAATGLPQTEPLPHRTAVAHAAFSPDGALLTTCTSRNAALTNGYIYVWDAQTGRPRYKGGAYGLDAQFVTFTPEGDAFLIGAKTYLGNLLDSKTFKNVAQIPSCWEIYKAIFSPDKKWLLVAGTFGPLRRPGAQVFDANSLRQISAVLPHSDVRALDAAFSQDGQRVVTAGTHVARVWDPFTAEPLTPWLKHHGPIASAIFSMDGESILTASSDRTARLWDSVTGQVLSPPMRHSGAVCNAVFTTDGRRIVTGCEDGAVRVWTVASRPTLDRVFVVGSSVQCARFSTDGRKIVTADLSGAARVWDAKTGEEIEQPMLHPTALGAAEFSPDGHQILTIGQRSSTWTEGAWLWSRAERRASFLGIFAFWAEFSTDGHEVLTAEYNDAARIWSTATALPNTPLFGENFPPGRVEATRKARFSHDGRWIVTPHDSGYCYVWDVMTRKPQAKPLVHDDRVTDAAFSPDGNSVVTVSADHTARLWETRTSRMLCPPLKHWAPVRLASFSPNGQRVVTSSDDGTAQIWDAQTGRPIGNSMRHEGSVVEARFSPDGHYIATASFDGRARVWKPEQEIPLSLLHGDRVHTVAFSPDGRRLLTASADGTARLWELPRDDRPLSDLASLSFLLSGEWPNAVPASPLAEIWQSLRQSYPAEFDDRRNELTLDRSTGRRAALAVSAAHDAEANRNWRQASAMLTRLVALEPTQWEYHYRLGRCQSELGRWLQAVSNYNRALELKPEAGICWVGRFRARSHLGNADGADVDLRKALEFTHGFRLPTDKDGRHPRPDPCNPVLWEALATDCSRELSTNQNSVVALCARGLAEAAQQQWRQALWDFRDAARLQSNAPTTLAALALIRRGTGSWSNALVAATSAFAQQPNDQRMYALRAEAHENLKHHEQALADYRRALELGADPLAVHLALATNAAVLGRWSAALTNAIRSVDLAPDDFDALDTLAWLLTSGPPEIRDATKALPLARRAAALRPNDPRALRMLGIALYRSEELVQAAKELENSNFVLGTAPPSNALFFLAMSHHRLGHTETAANYYRSAAKQLKADSVSLPQLEALATEAQQLVQAEPKK